MASLMFMFICVLFVFCFVLFIQVGTERQLLTYRVNTVV